MTAHATPPTLAETLGSKAAVVDALAVAFDAVEVTPPDGGPSQATMDREEERLDQLEVWEHRQQRRPPVQAGPRCPWPRMVPPPPSGPPIEPPGARVSDATWTRWAAERQRRIDARRPPPRDARRAIAVALSAEFINRDTASARCPICDGVLAIRWRGELTELHCLDGCPPADVERAVAGVIA